MSESKLKQKKVLALYAEGINQLDEVLKSLSESDIDLSRDQGKWTIRQIIHHIADVEDIWKTCIKAALGNPDCTVDLSWYILDNKCAEPLDYAHKPIGDAIELFSVTRRHIVELVNHLPGAWERSFTVIWRDMPDAVAYKVGDAIGFQDIHLEGHIKQIRETREKHGI